MSHSPRDMALAAEAIGVKKARTDTVTLLGMAVLAGAFIGLGAMFANLAVSGAEGMLPYGVIRLLAGAVFSLGLILILVGGAQLFTGDMLMVIAWASGRIRVRQMLRVWTLVWLGNFAGAVVTALLVFLSGQYAFGHGAVGAAALHSAVVKTAYPAGQAFVLGILCNVLVCLAVWLALAAKSVADKVAAVFFPITAFVAAGFEHSVANMYYVPLGMFIRWWAPNSFWDAIGAPAPAIRASWFLENLAAVTLGNWVGGAVLVGAAYWIVYLRRQG